MAGLKEEDSGTYQGEAKDSSGGTIPYKKILLQVCLEIQDAAELFEEKCTLAEGQTLKVSCPTNTIRYSNSQKAWQRLKDNREVQTLAITEGSSQVQVGKYFLEDIPSEGMLQIRMTNLQVEDSGLYRCVILRPSNPIILFYPVRLVVTKNSLGTPDSDENPCQISAQNPTLPPVTTKLLPRPRTRPRPRPVTQLVPTSADRLSSPGFTVTPTNVTHVTRAPGSNIIISAVCGLLSKTLVFISLFVVTQRSFAS